MSSVISARSALGGATLPVAVHQSEAEAANPSAPAWKRLLNFTFACFLTRNENIHVSSCKKKKLNNLYTG